MPRQINLRQVEAFKAVIETGTVSRAAAILNISQPAMSKLIAHLEDDTGLKLFDRVKGRLAPTERGMRLYEEIDRIFAGIRQVENAVDAIRREQQGQLLVGVMPALSGSFIQQATMGFLKGRPGVFCSVQSRSSQWIVGLARHPQARRRDWSARASTIPISSTEPLMEHPLVCIMARDHRAGAQARDQAEGSRRRALHLVRSGELHRPAHRPGLPDAQRSRQHRAGRQCLADAVRIRRAGLGVSLVHPLMVSGMQGRLAVRRFEPAVQLDFQLCRIRDSRNAGLVDAFVQETRATAKRISRDLLSAG